MIPTIVFHGAQLASLGEIIDGYLGLIVLIFAPIPILFVNLLMSWNGLYLFFPFTIWKNKYDKDALLNNNKGVNLHKSFFFLFNLY